MPDRRSTKLLEVAPSSGGVFLTPDSRPEASVKLRSRSNDGDDNSPSRKRQRQLPPARPGTFMRLSAPRFRRSCSGAIVSAALDDHASLISSEAASLLSPGGRLR